MQSGRPVRRTGPIATTQANDDNHPSLWLLSVGPLVEPQSCEEAESKPACPVFPFPIIPAVATPQRPRCSFPCLSPDDAPHPLGQPARAHMAKACWRRRMDRQRHNAQEPHTGIRCCESDGSGDGTRGTPMAFFSVAFSRPPCRATHDRPSLARVDVPPVTLSPSLAFFFTPSQAPALASSRTPCRVFNSCHPNRVH
jgi:hypothetical protein